MTLENTIRREWAVLLKDQPELQAVIDLGSEQLFRKWVVLALAVQQRRLRIQSDRQY
jgi:hypothetical protein